MTRRNLDPNWHLDARAVSRHLWAVAIVGVLFMGWWMAASIGKDWQ